MKVMLFFLAVVLLSLTGTLTVATGARVESGLLAALLTATGTALIQTGAVLFWEGLRVMEVLPGSLPTLGTFLSDRSSE